MAEKKEEGFVFNDNLFSQVTKVKRKNYVRKILLYLYYSEY